MFLQSFGCVKEHNISIVCVIEKVQRKKEACLKSNTFKVVSFLFHKKSQSQVENFLTLGPFFDYKIYKAKTWRELFVFALSVLQILFCA